MSNSKRRSNYYQKELTSTVKQLHQHLDCVYLNRQLPLSYITINMEIKFTETIYSTHTHTCTQEREREGEREGERESLTRTGTTQGC